MSEVDLDPWAWAHQDEVPAPPDATGHAVTAVVVAHDSERWLPDFLASRRTWTYPVERLIAINAGSKDGTADVLLGALAEGLIDEVRDVPASTFGGAVDAALGGEELGTPWLWLLHDDAQPAPTALELLIDRGRDESGPAAVTPLLLTPRRRGVGSLISELGETVSVSGRVSSSEVSGVLDQGQLGSRQVLGASTCGLLVRTDVWTALGGLAADLPSSVQGLDFGARLTRSGRALVTEPTAKVHHVEASLRGLRRGAATDPVAERRAYGLAFDALLRGRSGSVVASTWASGAASTGLLIGKDLDGVSDERAALRVWRTLAPARRAAADRFAALPRASVASLRPTRRDALRSSLDDLGGRIADWGAGAAERTHSVSLDHLTGDDFSGSSLEGHGRRWPWWVITAVVLVTLSLIAARDLFIFAPLRGSQLLPAPDTWTGTLHAYLDPIAGLNGGTGAPWTGLVWLASLPFFGSTDALVTVLLLGCIPAAFVLGRRLIGLLSDDRVVAVAGGVALALGPAMVGALGTGQIGACVSLLLVLGIGSSLVGVHRYGQTWSSAARLGLQILALTALTPLMGAVMWVAAAVVSLLRPGRAATALALVAPLLLLASPWASLMVAYPGRLLTGIAPALAPSDVVPWWHLLLGRPAVDVLPPPWLSYGVVGFWWVAALVGMVRRTSAGWVTAFAACCGLAAVAVSRTGVEVPPHAVVVPQATEWVLVMLAALAVASALGFSGASARARTEDFGIRQFVVAGVGLLVAASLAAGTVWWVGWGMRGLERGTVGAIPPFIMNDSERGMTRTLALVETGDTLTWAVQEGDLPRLGDSERGFVFAGDPRMSALAASVTERIVARTADEQIVGDLQSLGIGYLWLEGGEGSLRTDISNIPGLGVGSVEDNTATWTVPQGGIVQSWSGDVLTPLDPDQAVEAGPAGRTLVLAQPADPRWTVAVGGATLVSVPDRTDPTFDLGQSSGALEVRLTAPTPWWAWSQAAGLVILIVVGAPSLRPQRPTAARVGRRAA